MLSAHSSRFLPALLLLAAFSLGGFAAQAQERGDERAAPAAGLSSAPESASGRTFERETASLSPSQARFSSDGTESAALRLGFKLESRERGARLEAPTSSLADSTPSFVKPPADSFWQNPQGSQTATNKPAPLTPGQKMERAFRRAFLSPMPYASAAFSATITQIGEDDLPHKTTGDKVADGLSRMAINFGRSATRTVFAGGIYASLFKQDPRYDRSQGKGFGGKVLHAVSRVFVTRDDDWNVEPNYSRFAGVLTASALSNAWERSTPGHDRIGIDATFRRFGKSFINDAITNILFRELLPDIF
jgi:hypothetical protein